MKNFYITIALLISTISFAQQSLNDKAQIDVIGKSEMEISPDEIYIDIFLEERMEKGKKLTLEQLESELKKELQAINIPTENLFISDINSVLSKTGWWSKEILSTGKYSLQVKSSEKIKKVFKVFKKLKITRSSIVKATHSKLAEFKKKNRINAIKAAKEKSNYLLNAINAKTGKPLRVNEIEHQLNDFAQINYVSNSKMYESDFSKSRSFKKDQVQFENIKLTSSIHVIFEIK
ncbi:SIMPL domain-containing protein [Tenacibaculum xiamenense]|uniref:SIMPL domain-containing protein n=1 Tax=Tenacibaculum xiamenense TaxID=1261553 RepID=UPI003893722E